MGVPSTEYVEIRLSTQVRLGIPQDHLVEMTTLNRKQICPIPGVLPSLFGVVKQSGKLLWILDLAQFLSDRLGVSPASCPIGETFPVAIVGDTPQEKRRPASDASDNDLDRFNCRYLACVVAGIGATHCLNRDEIRPLTSPEFSQVLDPTQIGVFKTLFSGIAWVEAGDGEPVASRSPLALLDVGALLDALQPV
ncbi:chemotaxis protein CheW [Oxynema sp. CENA135]|uniref:chemotaxis protein CheW n=1 Tax=Oxynema sp. CENA135 TaxID=984206 RepID=UPI00190CB5FC|nr:chemotaxis protein CheW [Oxynema sp. CENA135]MBK4732190.1 chemotaxis protein CheW [Oxynema sp. CENA135]